MIVIQATYAAIAIGVIVWLIGRYSERGHYGLNQGNEKKTKSELERKNGPSRDVWLLTTIDCDFGTVPQTAGPARTLNLQKRKTDSKKSYA